MSSKEQPSLLHCQDRVSWFRGNWYTHSNPIGSISSCSLALLLLLRQWHISVMTVGPFVSYVQELLHLYVLRWLTNSYKDFYLLQIESSVKGPGPVVPATRDQFAKTSASHYLTILWRLMSGFNQTFRKYVQPSSQLGSYLVTSKSCS